MHSLTSRPATDPTSIYRYRDGLYAADLLAAALVWLDFFTWLDHHPSDQASICRALEIKERPTDVMLTLFGAMGYVTCDGAIFSLTDLGREHLVKTSPWFIGPYYASLKDRPVCKDFLDVLRTDKPANWGSLKNEKEWAKAMEDDAFATQFTAAMDCRGVYLAQAAAKKLDLSGRTALLDIAGGSGKHAEGDEGKKNAADHVRRTVALAGKSCNTKTVIPSAARDLSRGLKVPRPSASG